MMKKQQLKNKNDTEIVILVKAKDWTKHTSMSAEIIKNIFFVLS